LQPSNQQAYAVQGLVGWYFYHRLAFFISKLFCYFEMAVKAETLQTARSEDKKPLLL
jgi:hypothetical protein